MAEYSFLKIRNYDFAYYKSRLNPVIPYLFSKNDLVFDGDNVCFKSTAENIKIAFKIAGYNNERIKYDFERYIRNEMFFEMREESNTDEEAYEKIKKTYTFEAWEVGVKKYFTLMLENYNSHGNYEESKEQINKLFEKYPPSNPMEREIMNHLVSFEIDGFYGLSYDNQDVDEMIALKLIIDCLDPNEIVMYDVSAPFNWSLDIDDINFAYNNVKKILVIVEGINDKKIIDTLFNKIYPQFKHLYNIVSFDGAIPGGCSFTRHYFNLLSNSNIDNRVIALFDNDTAGLKEINTLERGNYDKKYKYSSLPYNDFLKKYPTVFPNGEIVECDINGKACSLELYLPLVLISGKEGLEPIIWTSYDPIMKQHQGVIRNKEKIHKNFNLYASREDLNWDMFNTIFKRIFEMWA